MPLIETPPESPRESSPEPLRVEGGQPRRGARYGEMEHHELIHLLDEVDDERARARFREAIYISLIIWLVIGWLGVYGVRYLPHPPRLQSVNPEHGNPSDREMTYLETPRDLPRTSRGAPRTPPPASPKVAEQAPAMRAPQAKQPAPAERQPLPATPQPQTQAPPAATAPPPTPTRQVTPTPALPSTPKPSQQAAVSAPAPTRPNFGQTGGQTAGDAIRQAAEAAAQGGGLSGVTGGHGGAATRQNLNTGVDVLSDMQGVNFNPYLRAILQQIYNTWIPLIPEEARPPLNKKGETQIRFMILPDGRVGMMHLDGSTHDDALNRAAWGSITGVGTFPPLPKEFHGPNLELRIHYLVNERPE